MNPFFTENGFYSRKLLNQQMDLSTLFGFNLIISALTQIPWVILIQFTTLRLYSLRKSDECKRVQKKLTNSSHVADDGKRIGYSFGKWFVLHLAVEPSYEGDGDKYTLIMIATEASYQQLINNNSEEATDTDDEDIECEQSIDLWKRLGALYSPYFAKRNVSVKNISPRREQKSIMDDIKSYYDDHGHAVALIYGEPGTGKSVIGILLAKMFESGYCNTLQPWTPGVTLSQLYNEAEPTEDKPLIVMFDEVDVPLMTIHAGVEPHKCLTTEIANKTGWNKMFDEIDLGLYPNLIIVMTSNKNPDFINALDTCYIRSGRTNVIREMIYKND